MIYDSLDILPYKLFVKIEQDRSYWRLDIGAKKPEEVDKKTLHLCEEIWGNLYDEHLARNQTSESKKIFKLHKNIDHYICLHSMVIVAVACLRFDYNEEVHEVLKSHNYKLSLESTESYYESLDRIEKEANNYIVKAEFYKGMLPEEKEEVPGTENEYVVDDILAAYSAILGFDMGDFNVVSYNKYYGYHKQVEAKINSIKKQNSQTNAKK